MTVVNVNPVSLESSQARFQLGCDPAPGQPPSCLPARLVAGAGLSRDHHIVPAAFQGVPDEFFGDPIRVTVGSVDEVDSEVESLPDDPRCGGLVTWIPERVSAEADLGYLHAGTSEGRVAHDLLPAVEGGKGLWSVLFMRGTPRLPGHR